MNYSNYEAQEVSVELDDADTRHKKLTRAGSIAAHLSIMHMGSTKHLPVGSDVNDKTASPLRATTHKKHRRNMAGPGCASPHNGPTAVLTLRPAPL